MSARTMWTVAGAAVVAATTLAGLRAVEPQTPRGPVYVAYYWRAKPGQAAAYEDYIKKVAEPIDANARRAGAFEEMHTVTPSPETKTDWTHLRLFRLRDEQAAKALGAALDAATARVVPDEAKRKSNSEYAATLRDFVRQEVWTELR